MAGLAFVDLVFFCAARPLVGGWEGSPRVSDTGQKAAGSQAPKAGGISLRKDDRNSVFF